MGEVSDRDRVLAILIENGTATPLATLYRDLYCEYREAADNIALNGAVCANPRTGAPIQNPYLVIRDRARAQLLKLRRVNTAGLWTTDDAPGAAAPPTREASAAGNGAGPRPAPPRIPPAKDRPRRTRGASRHPDHPRPAGAAAPGTDATAAPAPPGAPGAPRPPHAPVPAAPAPSTTPTTPRRPRRARP